MDFRSFQDFLNAKTGLEIEPDANLDEAHTRMQARGVSVLVVVSEDAFCGVISEADILRHVSQHGGFFCDFVRDVMQANTRWVAARNVERVAEENSPGSIV